MTRSTCGGSSTPDLDEVAGRIKEGEWVGGHGGAGGPDEPPDRLGSTTHVAVIRWERQQRVGHTARTALARVVVPGTGVHVNNMLGEEDLNPQGFHRIPPGGG